MNAITSRITRYLGALRFPVLLLITLIIFIIDLFVPDVIPLVDEVLLALVVALLARLKRRPVVSDAPDGESTGEL